MYENSDEKLEYYISIGAVELEGIDENGEVIYSITELAKSLAPELWQAHEEYVDKTLLDMYQDGLLAVEYDENLEAIIKLSPEGYEVAKGYGLIEIEKKDIPDD